jgi:serine/threonine-protein kinase
MSEKHDQEYFADGVAEEILNALAQVNGLKVIGRTSSFSFKGKADGLRAIGQKLGASTLLEGSVRKEGSRLLVTAKLVQAANGAQVWSQKFERDQAKVFAVQEEIARAVVAALRVTLLPGRGGTASIQTTNAEAHRLLLFARHLHQFITVEAYDRAIGALRQAIRIAPDDARPWAELAGTLWARAAIVAVDGQDANAEAIATAEQAVALGSDLPDGYLVRGLLRHMVTWDWSAAQADEERGLALAPGSIGGRTNYARLLASTGNLQKAIETMDRVTEADPHSPYSWLWKGILETATGHPEKGEVSFRRGLDLAPNHAYLLRELGFALLLQNRAAEALALAERHPVEWMRGLLEAMAQHQRGNDAASRRALEHLLQVGAPASYQLAQVHAWRGEKDRAFEWLERGYATDDSGMRFTIHDPMIAGLRGDPRYSALLRKMNLPVE